MLINQKFGFDLQVKTEKFETPWRPAFIRSKMAHFWAIFDLKF